MTAGVQWTAANDAADAFPKSDGKRKALQTLYGVGGACGMKTTTRIGAKDILLQWRYDPIKVDQRDEGQRNYPVQAAK